MLCWNHKLHTTGPRQLMENRENQPAPGAIMAIPFAVEQLGSVGYFQKCWAFKQRTSAQCWRVGFIAPFASPGRQCSRLRIYFSIWHVSPLSTSLQPDSKSSPFCLWHSFWVALGAFLASWMEHYDHQKHCKLEHYVIVSAYCILRTSMNIHKSSLLAVILCFPYLLKSFDCPWTDLSQAPPGSRSWTRWMILHRQPDKNEIEVNVRAFSQERPMDSEIQDAQFHHFCLTFMIRDLCTKMI